MYIGPIISFLLRFTVEVDRLPDAEVKSGIQYTTKAQQARDK